MKKKEIKKKAYPLLYKENKTHQEVYEEYKTPKASFNKIIATELSKLPSKVIIRKFNTWRYIYVILMAIFIALRLLGTYLIFLEKSVSPTLKLIVFLLVIAVPVYGIFAMLTHRLEALKTVSFILIFSIVRASGDMFVGVSTADLIWITPMAMIIFLGFWLPKKMKTPYKIKTTYENVGGKKIPQFEITFTDYDAVADDEILDAVQG